MIEQERIVTPREGKDELRELVLRPQKLGDFVGQDKLKKNLSLFIEAAKQRGESLDHVIFYGPPGLGKTTLSQIIAHELDTGFRSTSGPMLTKPGELAAILTNLKQNDILFIDEIHILPILLGVA